MSASTRGLTPVLPLGLQATPPADGAGAVVLRLAGLGLEAEAVGERPAPRFNGLEQNRLFVRRAPSGFSTAAFTSLKRAKSIEIALRVGERGLIERIAGMKSDGARHGLRAREFKAGQEDVADKDLLALIDLEDDIDFAGIGGLGLLGDGHCRLIEAAAVVRGDDGVVIAGQAARRKHLARRGVDAAR